MKLTSRLLLGTIATVAAVAGGAVSAHADYSGPGQDDSGGIDVNSVLCPIAAGGLVSAVVKDLNPQSVPKCGPQVPQGARPGR